VRCRSATSDGLYDPVANRQVIRGILHGEFHCEGL
jgi:hypothetical protein